MKKLLRPTLLVGLAVALVASSLAPAFSRSAVADEQEPVVIVSVAGSDELLSDIIYLTQSAGVGDFGRLVAFLASPYTTTMDPKRPAGVCVRLADENKPTAISFLPVTNLKALLQAVKPQVGEAQDVGEGILEIASDRPQSLFLKEADGWLFVANKKDDLADLPKDPVKLLGGLEQQYTLAIRLHASSIPADLREQAVAQIRQGFEEGVAHQDDPQKAEAMRQFGGLLVESVSQLIKDTATVTLGWQVDASSKKTYLDVQLTAVEGTDLDKQMALIKEAKSAFSGFLLPDAALTFHSHATSTQAEIDQATELLTRARKELMKGIDKDQRIANAEERQEVRDILNQLLDVADETVKAGKWDCGAALVLKPESLAFAAGGFVADGQDVSDALKKLAALAERKDPNFPGIQFDAETYRNVSFHTARIPLQTDQEEVRRVLGDPMDIVLGIGKKAAYVAFGKDAAQLLKNVLDASAEKSKNLPPAQLSVSMTPVLEFAASMQSSRELRGALEAVKAHGGSDHISLTAAPIPHGCGIRLELEEGVLKAIGGATKAKTAPSESDR